MSARHLSAVPALPSLTGPGERPPERRKRSEGNRRILVVDDNPEIHDDFRRILGPKPPESDFDAMEAELFGGPAHRGRSLGIDFDLSFAFQGSEALRIVDDADEEGEPIAMIFQDMRMPPGWDGLETAQRIWERHPDIDIVFCTAYSDHSWEEIVRRVGVTDHLLILKKPFDVIEVQQIALSVTTKSNLAQRVRGYISDLEAAVRERTAHLKREMEERERLRAELFRAQKLESIGQLASGIAHEINTPIQYVGTNAEFLGQAFNRLHPLLEASLALTTAEAPTPETVENLRRTALEADLEFVLEEIPGAISQAREGIDRVAKIVGAMREFSHPGWKEKRDADLNEAVRSTVLVSQNEWKHVANLKLELEQNLPSVPCVVGEVNQALLNIIVNAAHAIREIVGRDSVDKGTIVVRTRRAGAQVEISVSDTGIGIDDSIVDRVFDPFFTTKEVGMGTGQGLSLAYAIIVEGHGGTIDFSTVVNQGTEFRLRLPIRAATRELGAK